MPRPTRNRLFGLVLAVCLVAVACDAGTGAATDAGGQTSSGTILIAGSSTVGPISEIVSEDFSADNPGVSAPVEITGTGGGFKDRFCTGETAINDASRPIKDSELELCADNGVTAILELQVAIDGITTMTSIDNDRAPACLNFAEMYALVGPESGGVSSWADANALVDELGGHAGGQPFEDAPLATAGPGTESGTYDSFYELAIEELAGERGIEDGTFRADWTGNNDDNVIIQSIIGNPYSFGWVGYAYYVQVSDQIRAFDVADEDGTCVAPTPETIASGDYPLSRPLFIYVNLDRLDDPQNGAALESYVTYYLSDAGYEAVAEAGYVQLTGDAWAQTQAAWEARVPNV
jgi:phosphate transport system substrate-binding protein